ncbi:MAG: hypothetical protein WCT07_00235 [Candidatus Paceibacterota bacterium]|jgi:hypothetical protein
MSNLNKKWSSFDEMYADLKNEDHYKHFIKKSTAGAITDLIKKIEQAKTSKDFFDCTCILSSIFDGLDEDFTHELYSKTNVYVLVFNATLRNENFIKILIELISKNQKISILQKEESNFDKLIFLNTAVMLAFFGIAIDYKSITKNSIEFLRKNTTDILRNILKHLPAHENNFIKLCFFLEKVAWDVRFHFNQNYDSKFPVKLDDNFLFLNLKTSRSLAGITFLSLIIRPVIENSFKKIINENKGESFNLSKSLDLIYVTSNDLNESIEHYYRNTSKDITSFFDIFIQKNERNLIFFFKKICSGFNYQDGKNFFEIVSEKAKLATEIKKELSEYSHKNFSAFNNKEITETDNEWTNKIFLISIKTFSVLEEINNAKDTRWSLNVIVHELNQWIVDVHEILNKYYIEDDWDKIKDFVIQENEKIEWKSSFYTPLEQEYRDEETDSSIKKKIFEKILKVILAMLNTEGGTLIVGIVENPEAIKREEIKNLLIVKNGLTFFDIGQEFRIQNKTLDTVRLQILDNLKQITDCTQDKFNSLIEFEPVILRNDNQVVSVIKISIKKSEKQFFNVDKRGSGGNSIWISLTKRAQGQNIDVDIRDYI